MRESEILITEFFATCASRNRVPRQVALELYSTHTTKVKVRRVSFMNQVMGISGLSYDAALILKSYIEEETETNTKEDEESN